MNRILEISEDGKIRTGLFSLFDRRHFVFRNVYNHSSKGCASMRTNASIVEEFLNFKDLYGDSFLGFRGRKV